VYVAVFDSVRPVYDFHLTDDPEEYRAREHTTTSLQRDMAKMKAWDLQVRARLKLGWAARFLSICIPPALVCAPLTCHRALLLLAIQVDRMRSQHVEGCLFIDSKRLKGELEPITLTAIDGIKALLSELARRKTKVVLEAFVTRSRTLDQRPPALDKFSAHVERVAGIREAEAAVLKDASAVEDMYKLLQSYDVKISSEDAVALDDMRNAGLAYTDSYRKSEAFLEERMPEMTRQLDVNIIKVNDSLKTVGEAVNDGAFIDASQSPETVLELLETTKSRFAALQDTADRYNKWQGLFGIPPYEFRQLKAAQKSLNLRGQLWQSIAAFDSKYHAWTEGPFEAVDAEELAKDVAAFLKTSYTLEKQVRSMRLLFS
jgi:hypothetical protein